MAAANAKRMMRGPSKLIILVSLVAALAASNAPTAMASSFALINFFWQDNYLSAFNPSAFQIIAPLPQSLAFFPVNTYFGSLVAFDDSMTTGPDPNSTEIARGRGTIFFVENDENGPGLKLSCTAQFNAASGYTNSTLTFEGFDRVGDSEAEIAIVGGTGAFRLARGWAVITKYFATLGIGPAVLNVTANVYYGS